MFSTLFHAVVYDPLYNALIGFIDVAPFASVGLAVIALTLLVRIILFPLFTSAMRTQVKIKQIEPDLKALRETYKDDPKVQAQKTMELYREAKVRPFSSIATLLIQIPIFIGLYLIFLRAGLPEINLEILYTFTPVPSTVNMNFLGVFDLTRSSIILALLAGVTQFFQIKVSPLGTIRPKQENPTMKDDFARSFQLQMQYGLPLLIGGIAYAFPSAVALYWITNNVFSIGQEVFVRSRIEAKESKAEEQEPV